MPWTNFHQHTYYCDGTDSPETVVQAALAQNVIALGFSSHAPIPFPMPWCMKREKLDAYTQEVLAVKERYADRLPIFLGLEIDYVAGMMGPKSPHFSHLDYSVGSVHLVGPPFEGQRYWEIDGTLKVFKEGLAAVFDNNIQKAVETYYAQIRKMVTEEPPDIVGHLDKVKMNNADNRFFSENDPWYKKAVLDTLETIAETGSIIEVNTRGIYKKKVTTTYPSPWILEHIRDMNIPIMLNSDAHHPREITRFFAETAAMLKGMGFKKLHLLSQNGWEARGFYEDGLF